MKHVTWYKLDGDNWVVQFVSKASLTSQAKDLKSVKHHKQAKQVEAWEDYVKYL